jgi:hypothetical protein
MCGKRYPTRLKWAQLSCNKPESTVVTGLWAYFTHAAALSNAQPFMHSQSVYTPSPLKKAEIFIPLTTFHY